MDMDEIVSRLAEASDADLVAALAAVNAQAAEASNAEVSEESVSTLERFADVRGQILAEQAARSDTAALAARNEAARGAFADGETPVEVETEAAPVEVETEVADTEEEAVAVTASGSAPLGTITARTPKPKPAGQFAGQVTTTTRSQGSTASFNAGTELTQETLADAILEKQNAISRSTVEGRQNVARIEFNYPPERTLSRNDSALVNSQKISSVTDRSAITAAGGLCAPLENIYDINVLGVTDRPVRDALTRFAVDRGGIQYRMPMDALAMTAGLGIWTAAMDAAVGVVETPVDIPDPAKTCAIIECPGVVEAIVHSTYLCLQYPNFSARFDREWVDATTRAAMVAWARFAENQLLGSLLTGSKLLTQAATVSGTRDVLVALDKSVAYYRNRHRLDSMVPLRLILPRWVLDLFRADLTRGFSGHLDALAVADAQIMGWFRARGVNVTFHLDGRAAETVGAVNVPAQFYANAVAGAVIPPFIDQLDAVLFAEGDWLYLDGGTLDLGVVRDSALNRINRYQTFVENWEGAAFNGIESLRLVVGVQPSGAVVGTIPPATTATPFTD